jgi:DNA-binding transcriptional MerR regulator
MFDITRNTLRFYEKRDLLKPAETDPATGYRYYGFAEIEKLHLILRYKESGMTLAEIKSYLDGKITAAELEKEMQKRLEAVKNGLDILRSHNIEENVYVVERIVLSECVCVVKPVVWTGSEATALEFCSFWGQQESSVFKIRHKYPDFVEWLDDSLIENGFIADSIPINLCIKADRSDLPKGAVTYPATDAVVTCHVGSYNTIAAAYHKLLDYIRENNLIRNGHAREVNLLGPFAVGAERFITKVILPVRDVH